MGTVLAFMMAVIGLSLPEAIILRNILKPKLVSYNVTDREKKISEMEKAVEEATVMEMPLLEKTTLLPIIKRSAFAFFGLISCGAVPSRTYTP